MAGDARRLLGGNPGVELDEGVSERRRVRVDEVVLDAHQAVVPEGGREIGLVHQRGEGRGDLRRLAGALRGVRAPRIRAGVVEIRLAAVGVRGGELRLEGRPQPVREELRRDVDSRQRVAVPVDHLGVDVRRRRGAIEAGRAQRAGGNPVRLDLDRRRREGDR